MTTVGYGAFGRCTVVIRTYFFGLRVQRSRIVVIYFRVYDVVGVIAPEKLDRFRGPSSVVQYFEVKSK